MAIHYNAFISYRHHPDDIKVASDIHRSLERFRVPKDLRKQGKTITRLFRDKDELPITSSLTSDIFEALENSDFLIVICSVHTKESVWVQREIETFLKTHSRNRVLTVLASGEPYDVIPEILLREQVVDPDTGELEWREYEPLSCDWRLKRKQAVREELPRLAAALLGCGYDQLRQRQRQYRMRRMITFFSVALAGSLALAAYFLHTSIQIQKANDALYEANIQIQDNLDQALQNQSDYLASVSQERMDAGDRLTALALALEALPNEENNRPYVANAEFALSNALASYRSSMEIRAVGALDAGSLVKDFRVTDDGKTIYILDTRNIITVWDTATMQQLSSMDVSAYLPDTLSVTAAGDVFFISSQLDNSLLCYGPEGNLLWEIPYCQDFAFLNDKESILVYCYDYYALCRILFIDPQTGKEIRDSLDLRADMDYGYLISFAQRSYENTEAISMFHDTIEEDVLCHLDLQTGALEELVRVETGLGLGAKNVEAVSAINADQILVMVSDGSGSMNGSYGTYHLYSASRAEIICISLSEMQELWKTDITSYVYSSVETMVSIPGENRVLCQWGNTLRILDTDTGELVMECITPSAPVTVSVDATSASGMLENGQFYEYDFTKAYCTTLPVMDGTVSAAQIQNGAFLLTPLSTQVQLFRSIRDDRGELLADSEAVSIATSLQYGKYLVMKDYYGIYMFDAEENKFLWRLDAKYSDELLQFSDDGSGFWIWDDQNDCVKFLSTETGDAAALEIPVDIDSTQAWFASPRFLSDGKLIYSLGYDKSRAIIQVDLATGKAQRWELPSWDSAEYGKTTYILSADDSKILYWEKYGKISLLHTSDGSIQQIMDTVENTPVALWDPHSRIYALAIDHQIVLLKEDGAELLRISLDTRKGVSMYFQNEELLVLCDDGSLWRYDLQGTVLSQTGLSIFNTFSSSVRNAGTDKLDISWLETEDGSLLVNALGAGNLLDTRQWKCRAYIPNINTYLTHTDQILCSGNNGYYLYRPYSTQEQMAYAQEILGNFELSDKEKEYYGIN